MQQWIVQRHEERTLTEQEIIENTLVRKLLRVETMNEDHMYSQEKRFDEAVN